MKGTLRAQGRTRQGFTRTRSTHRELAQPRLTRKRWPSSPNPSLQRILLARASHTPRWPQVAHTDRPAKASVAGPPEAQGIRSPARSASDSTTSSQSQSRSSGRKGVLVHAASHLHRRCTTQSLFKRGARYCASADGQKDPTACVGTDK